MKKIDLTLVWYSRIDLIGSFMHGHSEWNGQRLYDYERVIDFYRQGKFDIEGLITPLPATRRPGSDPGGIKQKRRKGDQGGLRTRIAAELLIDGEQFHLIRLSFSKIKQYNKTVFILI